MKDLKAQKKGISHILRNNIFLLIGIEHPLDFKAEGGNWGEVSMAQDKVKDREGGVTVEVK